MVDVRLLNPVNISNIDINKTESTERLTSRKDSINSVQIMQLFGALNKSTNLDSNSGSNSFFKREMSGEIKKFIQSLDINLNGDELEITKIMEEVCYSGKGMINYGK